MITFSSASFQLNPNACWNFSCGTGSCAGFSNVAFDAIAEIRRLILSEDQYRGKYSIVLAIVVLVN
jgi:hypothetical protein